MQKVHLDNSTSIQFKCKLLKNGKRESGKSTPTSEVNLPHTNTLVHLYTHTLSKGRQKSFVKERSIV